MKEACKILYQGGEHESVVKKSRFITALCPAAAEEEAVSFIAERKKKYWDASHSCWAFLIGEQNQLTRVSDDKEPPQTAGRPMLDVLLGCGIHNACAVVTRYFGGTLLGTGGLVRAYSSAVRECLKKCKVIEKCPGIELLAGIDYKDLGKIQYIAGELGIIILDTEYSDTVLLTLLAPAGEANRLKAELMQSTGGGCAFREQREVCFGKDGKEIIIF